MSQTTIHTKTSSVPATMKAWQWTQCTNALEDSIQLNPAAPMPNEQRKLKPGECLVKVHAAALNPVDYKLAELPVVGRMAIPKPAIPGLDFAGEVVKVSSNCDMTVGQKVFGKLEPKQQFGTLGEYIIGSKAGTIPMPENITMEQAATLGVCGLVTYQCMARNVKPGDSVLINGGSGGTGTFAIQIAKALGCTVTTTCSGSNIQMCKDLGATYVIDYTKTHPLSALCGGDQKFDFILDNIGSAPELYWRSPSFTKPGAKYVQIGSQVSLPFLYDLAFRFLVPTWLGGGERLFSFGLASTDAVDYAKISELVATGSVTPVVDRVIDFDDVPEGYRYLKKGHAKGKVVVRIENSIKA